MRSYRSTPESATQRALLDHHRRMLSGESGISPDVAAQRGYRSVRDRREVPEVFKAYQKRAPALLIPMYSPDRVTRSYQLRPDNPYRKKNGETYRYASPTGGRVIADVHPRNMERVRDGSVPLWITEGVKKGDALTSHGLCVVALCGVWMFRPKGSAEMLTCFDHIPLSGRRVRIVYDSDVRTKPEVQEALRRLVGDLEARGARVLVVYLPHAPDGSKQGVDDYLARGGNVSRLEEMARAFEPEAYAKARLARVGGLEEKIAALWEIWERFPWKGVGGHTRRGVMRDLIEAAAASGEAVEGGVRVLRAQRTISEATGTRQPTVSEALGKLEGAGLLRREAKGGRGYSARPAYRRIRWRSRW